MLVSILCLAGGVIVGSVVTQIIFRCKSGYGRFKLEPYDTEEEDGFYKINVAIPQEQNLLKVDKIILTKDK